MRIERRTNKGAPGPTAQYVSRSYIKWRFWIIALGFSSLTACYSVETLSQQAFRDHLSNKPPIRSLRFTEIDCESKQRRHFLAAVDTNGFFLREYALSEDPHAPISSNQWASSDCFYGQDGNLLWGISKTQIYKASKVDPVSNWIQVNTRNAKALLDSVLNLGVSGFTVQRGFVWNSTDLTRFAARVGERVTVSLDGVEVTEIPGNVLVSNGLVSKLEMRGYQINYEYATILNCPLGLPTKIIVGSSASNCDRIFEIESLVYGHADESAFIPEAKFVSTDFISIVLVTNGANRDLLRPKLVPPPMVGQKHYQQRVAIRRWITLGVMCGGAASLLLLFRTISKR